MMRQWDLIPQLPLTKDYENYGLVSSQSKHLKGTCPDSNLVDEKSVFIEANIYDDTNKTDNKIIIMIFN